MLYECMMIHSYEADDGSVVCWLQTCISDLVFVGVITPMQLLDDGL